MALTCGQLAKIIEDHMPFEGVGGGEPGDAGCSCDAALHRDTDSGYTWKGYCEHLAQVISEALRRADT